MFHWISAPAIPGSSRTARVSREDRIVSRSLLELGERSVLIVTMCGFWFPHKCPSTADSLRGYSFHAEMRRTRRERVEILVDHEDRKGARYTDGYVCILYVDM